MKGILQINLNMAKEIKSEIFYMSKSNVNVSKQLVLILYDEHEIQGTSRYQNPLRLVLNSVQNQT